MFLAIINDTYSEVKADLAEAENEFEMGEYFKQVRNTYILLSCYLISYLLSNLYT